MTDDNDGALLPTDAPAAPTPDDGRADDRRALQRRGVRLLSYTQLERGVRCDRARILARICRPDAELLVCRLETSIGGEDPSVRVLLVEVRSGRWKHRSLALPNEAIGGLIDALSRVKAST